ncbi:receptor-like protein EIX2 [Coffea eugenioides]|uniref:receptor-like protein EIX2 n=1 Tax=Coffea eugenioides TaxID=49369 RepID=UPI000F60EE1B|nr:receptor-like protein EIX2 [Coffea eugenioides]XP_027157945.1 receptor-like protein EIX2 [Coffea eugenioides]
MEFFPVIALLAFIFQLIAWDSVLGADAVMVNCSANDLEALLDFKNGLNDPENRLSSWRARGCCLWRGIACDDNTGAVIKIDLRNPYPVNSFNGSTTRYGFWNLSGEIRPSLLKLRSLTHLDLSSNTFQEIPIPDFFGSLRNLQYMNLSKAGFTGIIPPSLGNLSSLQYLDVSSELSTLSVDNFQWVGGLVSLKHLEMNQVDLSLVHSDFFHVLNMLPNITELHFETCSLSGSFSSLSVVNFTSLAVLDLSFNGLDSIPDWLVNISSLEYVDFDSCQLRGRIPLGLAELPRLRYLDLALNHNLSASCSELFKGSWKSIEVLSLSSNKLHGKLPANVGNMTSLTHFDLSVNNVQGGLPSSIGRLCNLEYLDLSSNNLTGTLPELLGGTESCVSGNALANLFCLELGNNRLDGKIPEWLGNLKSLQTLGLAANMLEGPIPSSLGTLKNLTNIGLAGNKLSGTLPETFGLPSELSVLDVSFNQLTGILTEAHFLKLNKLKILRLSANSFILNVSSIWIPPFQIRNLDTGSCQMGPLFPTWLQSQKEIKFLDISNASISGSIPIWFWDISANLSLLNVSFNNLEGQLPTPLEVAPFADVDLSSNIFTGPIPLPLVPIELLDLSNNHFSGPIPVNISQIMPDLIFLSVSNNELAGEIPTSLGEMPSLQVIDLSVNKLTGSIPASIGNCSYLKALDLGNNKLSGMIPQSLGQLSQLQSLHLNDNLLSDELPAFLKKLSSLETLDLGNNRLSGSIPSWFANSFSNLRILKLRENEFSGDLPDAISNLSSLQVLDLAGNNLTGRIPANLGNLKAMQVEQKILEYLLYGAYRGLYYEERLVISLKNQFQKYTKTLSLLTAIDLSDNNFYGNFPVEISKLSGLMVLNLSRNQISGEIPGSISHLKQLSSLDLSSNKLSGEIPSRMASLSFLSYLNLSNNYLSGTVPYNGQMSTFTASSFEGNLGLCGAPLRLECQNGGSGNGSKTENDSNEGFIDEWFYLSLGLGFLVGILVPYLIFAFRRPWADVYSDFVDKLVYKLPGMSRRRNKALQTKVYFHR